MERNVTRAGTGRYHRTSKESGPIACPTARGCARSRPARFARPPRASRPGALPQIHPCNVPQCAPTSSSGCGVGAFPHRLPTIKSVGNSAISLPIAPASPKGTMTPRPSSSNSQRVPIGRRHHRLPQSEAVGQRARGHLRFIQIGRDIDIAHRDECQQCRLIDEPVEEDDVVLDTGSPARVIRFSR